MLVSNRPFSQCRYLSQKILRRHASTQAQNPQASDIRNIAFVAHIDSGKTTLTESVLLVSNYLSTPGSVDTGSTTTDFLPAERERGITIQSASIPVKWKNYTYNLVDTPGHADFGMEVESASRVVDGAVVLLDSVEGVEAQTKGVWKQLDRYDVPTRLMFFNKLDRPGASLHSSYLSLLANRLHPQPIVLTLPVASFDPRDYSSAEPGIQGIVDLINWEVWKASDAGCIRIPLPNSAEELTANSPFPPSHPLLPHLIPARTQLLESLGMHSEGLFDRLLALPPGPSAYISVQPSAIIPYLRELTLRQQILPIVCGSALKHLGTELLMDYIGVLLANPLDVTSLQETQFEQVQMLAWKVSWDKRRGWMTFVRVYSGTLTKGATLLNTSRGQRERVTKLMLLYASQPEEIESLPFGSIGVLLGLKHTCTGDTLVSAFGQSSSGGTTTLREITPPPAVISASVIPNSYSDTQLVQDALSSLTRTDPSARVEEQEGQLLIHGLGALHLEIIEGRLRDEWGVDFQLGKRRVSYRESFPSMEISRMRIWKAQIAGQPVVAKISMSLRALQNEEVGSGPWGDNIVIDNEGVVLPSPESVLDAQSLLSNLIQGLSSTLSNSSHTGLPLSHLHLTIHSYDLSASSPPSTLAAASAHILREILGEIGMGPLMEPYVRIKVEVGEEDIGKVVKDLTEHRGEILDLGAGSTNGSSDYDAEPYSKDGLYIPPNWLTPCSALSTHGSPQVVRMRRSIYAAAPLSQMLDYSNRLRALSGGHGIFEMASEGFKEVGDARKKEILRELGRA
ncbi:translation elongation factor 2 [Ramaria rubella]|nr:translation elongation factor 2 [Ramaria rubella]